jgi:glycolate oxidase
MHAALQAALGRVVAAERLVVDRDVLASISRDDAEWVTIATIAHAGDGNLHPLLVTPPGDDAARQAAQAAFEEMIDAAIALGGTVTGEHGVGLLKRDGMRRELDPGALAMQDVIRRALDPLGICNPGKG